MVGNKRLNGAAIAVDLAVIWSSVARTTYSLLLLLILRLVDSIPLMSDFE